MTFFGKPHHVRLPVVAAITVPKTNQRGEVILGPGSKTQCGLIESRDAVSDPGVERGQGGHVETEEQAEKEAKQSAERRLKLSLQSLPFCSWAPDEHGWRQEATRLATLHDFFYLPGTQPASPSPRHPCPRCFHFRSLPNREGCRRRRPWRRHSGADSGSISQVLRCHPRCRLCRRRRASPT